MHSGLVKRAGKKLSKGSIGSFKGRDLNVGFG